MADDPIDRLLTREDQPGARSQGTMSEARRATSEVARAEERPSALQSLMRFMSRTPSTREKSRDQRQ